MYTVVQACLATLEAGASDHHLLTATIKSYLRWGSGFYSRILDLVWGKIELLTKPVLLPPESFLSLCWAVTCTRTGWRLAHWSPVLPLFSSFFLSVFHALPAPHYLVPHLAPDQDGDDKFDAVWNLLQHEKLPRENYKNIQYLFKVGHRWKYSLNQLITKTLTF